MKQKVLGALIGMSMLMFQVPANAAMDIGDMYMKCGIGGIIFNKKEHEALAAISNITWDIGTTAVLSGVSSPESCKGSQVVAAAFVYHSYASLETDIARGEGEYLDAVAGMMGCSANQAEFVQGVRQNFAESMDAAELSDADRVSKAQNMYIMLEQQSAMACNVG